MLLVHFIVTVFIVGIYFCLFHVWRS